MLEIRDGFEHIGDIDLIEIVHGLVREPRCGHQQRFEMRLVPMSCDEMEVTYLQILPPPDQFIHGLVQGLATQPWRAEGTSTDRHK